MRISNLQPGDQRSDWSAIDEMVRRSCEESGGTQTLEHIKAQWRAGKMEILVGEDEAGLAAVAVLMVTNLAALNGLSCVIISLCGRGMAQWLDRIELFERYAQWRGCRRMVIYGRRGWVRVLDDHGYTEAATLVTKELENADVGPI